MDNYNPAPSTDKPNHDSPEWKACVRKEEKKIYKAIIVRIIEFIGAIIVLGVLAAGILFGTPHIVNWWNSLVLPWWLYPSIGAVIIIAIVVLLVRSTVSKLAECACEERYVLAKKQDEQKKKEIAGEPVLVKPVAKPAE